MRKLSTEHKLKTIIITTHLLFLGGMIFAEQLSYWYLLITLFSVAVIGKIGGEVGFHRYFAHKSFKTAHWKSRVLLILGSLNLVGSTLSWAGTHRVHHLHTDKDKDPHSPYTQHPFKVWVLWWKPFQISTRNVADMIKDPWQLFIHKWYFELALILIIILGLIDFKLLMFGLLLPSIIQFHVGSLLIDIVCHKWGYRNFETSDHSRNNTWVNLFTGGSGLHNNHHGRPGDWNYVQKKGEWDIWGSFIKYFLLKHENT
jgi:fatty-acid desaturase